MHIAHKRNGQLKVYQAILTSNKPKAKKLCLRRDNFILENVRNVALKTETDSLVDKAAVNVWNCVDAEYEFV